MNSCAAERDLKRVAVNRREPHLPQHKPASSSVRVSPNFALPLMVDSIAWHMQQLAFDTD